MQLPTQEHCYQLMCGMQMLDHIVIHSLQVCRVATFLADYLNRERLNLNVNLIRAAALLHDVTKTRSFKTKEDHAFSGGQYLSERGYPEVGNLVRQHVRLDKYANGKSVSEVEIINYADKRVLHDEIVSLDQRLNYILERYARKEEHRERIHMLWQKTKKLEKRIFSDLSFAPADLMQLLPAMGYAAELQDYQRVCAQLFAAKR